MGIKRVRGVMLIVCVWTRRVQSTIHSASTSTAERSHLITLPHVIVLIRSHTGTPYAVLYVVSTFATRTIWLRWLSVSVLIANSELLISLNNKTLTNKSTVIKLRTNDTDTIWISFEAYTTRCRVCRSVSYLEFRRRRYVCHKWFIAGTHTSLARVSHCWRCVCVCRPRVDIASTSMWAFYFRSSLIITKIRLPQTRAGMFNAHRFSTPCKRSCFDVNNKATAERFTFSISFEFGFLHPPVAPFDSMDSMACRASAEITHKYLSNVNLHFDTVPRGLRASGVEARVHFTRLSRVWASCNSFGCIDYTLSKKERNRWNKTSETRLRVAFSVPPVIHAPTYDSYQLFIYYAHVKWKNLLEAIAWALSAHTVHMLAVMVLVPSLPFPISAVGLWPSIIAITFFVVNW